jgi:hypothetical protein
MQNIRPTACKALNCHLTTFSVSLTFLRGIFLSYPVELLGCNMGEVGGRRKTPEMPCNPLAEFFK